MLKTLRIIVLLFILAIVAVTTWRTRVASVQWKRPLPVNLYPVNGDGRAATRAYIGALTADDFKQPIEAFMRAQALRHGREAQGSAVDVRLGPPLGDAAMPPPAPLGGGALQAMAWSLKMRWWAYRHGDTAGPGPQVKLYLLYFDPAQTRVLDHSVALQEGLTGVVKVFASADMAAQNNIVIVHEFLHTLGATDKYDFSTSQPLFPDGYAEPQREPPLPQRWAEVMGGRLALSPTRAELPASLNGVVIGEKTAREINWLPGPP